MTDPDRRSQQPHNDWENRYQNKQTAWDRGQSSPAVEYWLKTGELMPSEILIPGCGYGHEVIELCRHGFTVTAVDIASTAIRALKTKLAKENLTASILQQNILDWLPANQFNTIYEQTCLCALEPDDWVAYEKQCHYFLKPSGKLFALFMQTHQTGGPPFHCDIGEMQRLFPASRWNWNSHSGKRIPHPVGHEELAFVLERI